MSGDEVDKVDEETRRAILAFVPPDNAESIYEKAFREVQQYTTMPAANITDAYVQSVTRTLLEYENKLGELEPQIYEIKLKEEATWFVKLSRLYVDTLEYARLYARMGDSYRRYAFMSAEEFRARLRKLENERNKDELMYEKGANYMIAEINKKLNVLAPPGVNPYEPKLDKEHPPARARRGMWFGW